MMMLSLYNAFATAGFSMRQALALTAEVGRENDYREELIFGHHHDSKRVNYGMLSWNLSRGVALVDYLKIHGLVDKDGNFVHTQKCLEAQAQFIRHEIETAYPKTKAKFLDNPNITRGAAASILGSDYIRWDMAGHWIGKAGALRASTKRDRYYDQAASLVKKVATPDGEA